MANCSNCGKYMQPKENVYKRQVYSGKSRSVYYGRRINFGTRSYYSVKSVCEDCAKKIDEQNASSSQSYLIVVFVIAILILLYVLLK